MNAGQKADAAAVLERADRRRYALSGVDRALALLGHRVTISGLAICKTQGADPDAVFEQMVIELGADLVEYLRHYNRDVGRAFTAMLDVADERRRDA